MESKRQSKQEESKPTSGGAAAAISAQGVSGIKYLFILQLASRGFTFILNTIVAAHVETAVYGVANIQMQLLLNLILFLSREAFRRACMRSSLASAQEIQKSVNVSWLSVPWGFLLSVLISWGFLWLSNTEELSVPGYVTSMWLIGFASAIEMLSEPAYILTQNLMLYRVRVAIEASAVLLRCICVYVCVTIFKMSLYAFAFGQVTFSATILFGYYGYFLLYGTKASEKLKSFAQLFPSLGSGLDSGLLGMVRTFLVQSLEKLVLQEGEKIVLRGVASLVNQGVFGVVNGLGSLITRILFQPIEEGAYPMFNKLLHDNEEKASKKKDDDAVPSSDESARLSEARSILVRLLRILTLLGLIIVSFGPNYSFVLLSILYPKYSNTEAPAVLGWYCLYILLMGINGITEAFAHASADEKQLKRLNYIMIVQSAIFIGAAIILISALETVGMIFASCISMAIRISTSLWWINGYYRQRRLFSSLSLREILPHKVVTSVLVISFIATYFSSRVFCSSSSCSEEHGFSMQKQFMHIGVGGAFGVASLAACYLFEKDLLVALVGRRRS